MKNITSILITAIIAIMPLVAKGKIQYNKLFDGSYYSIDTENKTATLTSGKDAQYVNIPEKITVDDVEYTVTVIGAGAFSDGYTLKTVVIPATVTMIKAGSYNKTFPDKMTELFLLTPNAEIEKNAFIKRNTDYGLTVNTVPGHKYTADNFTFDIYGYDTPKIKIGTYTFDADGMIQMTEVTGTMDVAEFTDEKNFKNDSECIAKKATYTRKSVTAGNWCSLCLPFDCEVPKGATVYEFIEMKSDAVVISEVEKITAGIPYVFKSETGGDVTFSAENALIKTLTELENISNVTNGNVHFIGALRGYSFVDTEESKEKYPLVWGINTYYGIDPTDNTFKRLKTFDNSSNLKSVCYPYHAFIQVDKNSSSAPALKVIHGGSGDGTTAIDAMEVEKPKNNAVYNLNGQRMAAPRKGINIINGKKVIIK